MATVDIVHRDVHSAHHDAHAHPTGWRRYLYSTNHKDIGTMYLCSRSSRGVIGGLLSIGMRLELQEPGMQIFASAHTFNVFVTAHGLIMVFFMIMPALIGGFGNWFVPIMIGAPDMAFPRMNNISFWLLPAAITLLVLSLFVEGPTGEKGVGAGWTVYAPLSTTGHPGPAMDFGDPVAASGWSVVDPRRHQFHHHDLQHARARHDHAQDAAVRVVGAGDGFPAAALASRACGRDHDAADRPQFRHDVLHRRGRRRPGAVPASVLVLRPPGSLHSDPAGLRDRQPDRRDLLEEAGVRLSRHGLCDGGDRRHRLRRVGAPHVHGRHVDRRRRPISWPRPWSSRCRPA